MNNIIQIRNNNAFGGRNGHTPRYVILHGTAGGSSAQGIADYFVSTQGGANPVSAHYVIGTDGTIVQCNDEGDGAWANGVFSAGHDSWWDTSINPNNVTISIEHCKTDTENANALTPAQEASSFALIHDICTRWNIPFRWADGNGGVTGHFSIDPVERSHCPGNYPWDTLFSSTGGTGVISNSGMYSPTSSDFGQWFTKSDDNHWTCKQTGHIVQYGTLNVYSQLSFDGQTLPVLGLPRSNEIYHDLGNKKVIVQFFERGVLVGQADPYDHQSGMPTGYVLAKREDFRDIDPDFHAPTQTVTVTALPDNIKADIAKVEADEKKLDQDAGIQ